MPSLCLCIIYLHKYVRTNCLHCLRSWACADCVLKASKSKLNIFRCPRVYCQYVVRCRFSNKSSQVKVKWVAQKVCRACGRRYTPCTNVSVSEAWGAPVNNFKYRHMHDNIYIYIYTRNTCTYASLKAQPVLLCDRSHRYRYRHRYKCSWRCREYAKTGFGLCVLFSIVFSVTYLRNFTFVFFRKLMTFTPQLRAVSRSET